MSHPGWLPGWPAKYHLADVDLSAQGEMEIFGLGVGVVVDELYMSVSSLLAAGVEFPASDIPQDSRPLKDSSQFSYIVNCSASFVKSPNSSHSCIFWRRMGVTPWPLRSPSKSSTTRWQTQW